MCDDFHHNFPTPHCHPQSFDSASTPEAFAKREVELGTGAVTVTDHGSMAACRRVYDLAKKNNLTPILGLEAYFRDDDCPILKAQGVDKVADYLKYYHLTIHALDEEAFQTLSLRLSNARLERHGSAAKPLFTWEDLEEIGSKNVTMTSGCLVGMVQRHILAHDNLENADRYYQRLRSVVKPGNFYVEVFPHKCDANWESGVFVTLDDGTEEGIRLRFWDKKKLKLEHAGEGHAYELAKLFQTQKWVPGDKLVAVMNQRKWEDREPLPVRSIEKFEGFIRNECTFWAPNGDVQKGCNRVVMALAKKYGDKILISDDSHYATPDEKVVQDIRLAQMGSWRFYGSYHRQSSADAYQYFRNEMGIAKARFEEWIENNREWADKFKDFKFDVHPTLPTKFYPENTLLHTKKLIDKHGRMDWSNPVYVQRLKDEISLLHHNGTIDLLPYFFLGEDICSYYESIGRLTGPGRGSAAGLLLTYLLGITHIDPLRYGLSMERFLTLDRIKSGKLPDIDQDLGDRDPLVNPDDGWLYKRFGADHVAQISTNTTLRLKSSVKDVIRARYGHVLPEVEELTNKFILPPQGVSDHDFVFGYEDSGEWKDGSIEYDKALQTFVERFPEDWEIVKKCLGLTRQQGRHACAFVIANRPVAEFLPLMDISGFRVTQYTKDDVEAAGGLKMDFLVVNSLNDIQDAIKLIQERSGLEIPEETIIDGRRVPGIRLVPRDGKFVDIWDLPEDQAVFQDVAAGRTETVFQFNTPGATQWLKHFNYWKDRDAGRKAIDSLEAMSAFTALDRPGPLGAEVEASDGSKHNMLVEYARRARGEEAVGSFPIFHELLPETYGVMCIAKGSRVKTRNGLVKIEEILVGTEVQTETGEYRPVLDRLFMGRKETVRVRLTNGEELRLTSDHKVMTARGWVEAGELTRRDIVKQFWVSDEKIEEGDDRDWLIGLLLADGDLCASTPTVCCSDEKFAMEVKEVADRAFGLNCRIYQSGAWYVALRHMERPGTTPNPLTRYLRELGLKGLDCYTKRFPSRISISMLAGFFEGDGCVKNKRVRLKNEMLARDFFEGLQRARIHSALYEEEDGVWTVSVRGRLPLRIKPQPTEDVVDFVPTPTSVYVPRSDQDRQLLRRPFLGRRVARRLEKYGAVIDDGIWGKVLSVRKGEEVDVYDLSVADIHSFVTGGSVTHNCYQEQLQKMYQALTGCTGAEAEEFRSNVAKKKMDKVLKAYGPWMDTVGERLGRESAQQIWDSFVTWGQYGFNKSHSICYSAIGYACAYLKHHFPLEWWCAVLRNADKNEVNETFWRYCGHLIDIPDVTRSTSRFEIVGDRIQAPISLLHGVGPKAHETLLRYAPYVDIEDFCRKLEAHSIDNATPVLDENGKPKMVTKSSGRGKNKRTWEEPKMKRASNPLNRGVCYQLIVSGVFDRLFPDPNAHVLDKLQAFEVALAKAKGKRKPQPIHVKYINMDAFKRFQMRKAALPAYSEPLLPMYIDCKVPNIVTSKGDDGREVAYLRYAGGTVPFLTPHAIAELEALQPFPDDVRLVAAMPAFVVAQRTFRYHGNKEACELELDVDGVRLKYVKWPDREMGLNPLFKTALTGSLTIAVVSKYREDRPFGLDDLIIVRGPVGEEDNDTESSPDSED